MPREIEDHHIIEFSTQVRIAVQQGTSRFQDAVEQGKYQGKAAQVVVQFGEVEMQPLSQSQWKDPTAWSEMEHLQRWVLPSDFSVSLPLTRQDQIRSFHEPKSIYAENIKAAYARKFDSLVIAAATGQAKVGSYEAMSEEALPAGQILASDGEGMSIAKLLAAKELLDAAENEDSDERFMALTSRQVSDLLNSTEIKSADYNSVRALAQGELNSFMGFKFIRSERLLVEGGERCCFAWAKSGLHVGAWDDLTIKVDERADRNYVWQIYARATLGATRTSEKKVVRIDCAE